MSAVEFGAPDPGRVQAAFASANEPTSRLFHADEKSVSVLDAHTAQLRAVLILFRKAPRQSGVFFRTADLYVQILRARNSSQDTADKLRNICMSCAALACRLENVPELGGRADLVESVLRVLEFDVCRPTLWHVACAAYARLGVDASELGVLYEVLEEVIADVTLAVSFAYDALALAALYLCRATTGAGGSLETLSDHAHLAATLYGRLGDRLPIPPVALAVAPADVCRKATCFSVARPSTVGVRKRLKDKGYAWGGAPFAGGTYGSVWRATRDGRAYAVKRIDVDLSDGSSIMELALGAALQRLRATHTLVMLDYELVENPYTFAHEATIVYELMSTTLGGYVARRLKEGALPHLPEGEARFFLHQLLIGVDYLHSAGFVHRDIKPANVLVHGPTRTLKLADFGMAQMVPLLRTPNTAFTTSFKVQSLPYRAPEVLFRQPYAFEVDIWSVGCIAAEFALGAMCFQPTRNTEVDLLIAMYAALGRPPPGLFDGAVDIPLPIAAEPGSIHAALERGIGRDAYEPPWGDLLLGLLDYDPTRRLAAHDALDHPFFVGRPSDVPPEYDFAPPVESDDSGDAPTAKPAQGGCVVM